MSTWAAILAGGSGTRFWPLSTPERPKQFLPLTGERPLLAQAVDRLHGLVAPEHILILTGPTLVERVATAKLPTEYGEFTVHGYRAKVGNTEAEHIALTMGDVASGEPVLVRVHDECLTGDTFHSVRCDCGEQLDVAMKRISEEGRGVLLYLRQEGRGIGLMNKLRAYALQDEGLDTVEANERLGFKADERERGVGVQILLDLGIRRARILTNNPQKLVPLYGLEVVERIPIEVPARATNRGYLATKRNKLGHLLTVVDGEKR